MAEKIPLKLVDVGGGAAELRELAAGDTIPSAHLDATLAAIAALTTAANQLIYATGVDTFAVSGFTAAARSLMDDADTLAMRATLELVKQAATDDFTSGRVLISGAGGLGGVPLGTGSESADTFKGATGWYNNGGLASTVFGAYPYIMAMSNVAGTVAAQLGLSLTTDKIGFRRYGSGAWSTVCNLFHTANIVGTVSQTAGVPTGAIIERGSNANGEYVKFADGTMECWTPSITVVGTGWTSALAGALKYSASTAFTWAATFISAPVATPCVVDGAVGTRSAWSPYLNATTTGGSVYLSSIGAATSTADAQVRIRAVGRWYA